LYRIVNRKGYIIILLAGCAVLMCLVREHVLLARFDLDLALALHHRTTQEGAVLAQWVSLAGSPISRALMGLLVTVGLLLRRERVIAVGWIVALGGGGIFDVLLKQLFNRPRPPLTIMYTSATGPSFPSGHAMGAIIAYGMLAYIIKIHSRARALNTSTIIITVVLVTAIGFSRLYLGVHYLSDVLGGYTVGAIWLMTCITGTERARFQQSPPRAHSLPADPCTARITRCKQFRAFFRR
jgi:undecaprenyl-diphosphatase